MTAIVCNSFDCDHNKAGTCTALDVKHIDKRCRTYYRSNIREVMGASFRSGCHKSGGKYRSDNKHMLR